ncbi:WD40 repeat domain-containing protein [Zooshikella sp. RANM57]|uniref:WD40 repeat domain-containing protein n=1 Tax=Zooshikella sp. RANM57 TaxID=3425863 RepID=UPI003D6EFF61
MTFFIFLVAGCSQKEEKFWELAVVGNYTSALSHNGKLAMIGSINHGGSLWQFPAYERRFNWNHQEGVFSFIVAAAFSGNNELAVTADNLQSLVLWSTVTGEPQAFWRAPGDISSVALSNAGNIALLGLLDNRAILFNIKSGGVERTYLHADSVNAVAISDDNMMVLSGSDDYTAKLWDTTTGKLIHNWDMGNKVVSVSLSANHRFAFMAAANSIAQVRDTKTGELVYDVNPHAEWMGRGPTLASAIFSDNEQLLLTGTTNREIKLHDLKQKKVIKQWQVSRRQAWKPTGVAIQALAFGQDQFYALGSNGLMYALR